VVDWRDPDEELSDGWSPIGSPRPEPVDLMTARQLVNAFVDARTPEDREYAVEEAESFLVAGGDEVSDEALLAFLHIPATELTMTVLDSVATDLAARAPGTVAALLDLSLRAADAARQNAAIVLGRLSAGSLAAALVAILRRQDVRDAFKKAEAARLIAVGRPAATHIFDALAEPEPRSWIAQVAGCPPKAGDAEVMRSLDRQWREDLR